MRLVAQPSGSGATSLQHFNFQNEDGSWRRYTIGKDPVAVPDGDAKTILHLVPEKVGVHQEPVKEPEPVKDPEPAKEPGKTRRSKDTAGEG